MNNDISWSTWRESEIATSHPPGARCNDKTFTRGFSTSILRRAGWAPCLEEVRREGQPAVMLLSLVTVRACPETEGRESSVHILLNYATMTLTTQFSSRDFTIVIPILSTSEIATSHPPGDRRSNCVECQE